MSEENPPKLEPIPRESREPHELRTTPESLESHESDQDLVQAKDVVMASYPLSDGTPFYFPARRQDVQNHREGALSTTDLLSRSGQLPPRDDEDEKDHIVQVGNTRYILAN